jgi:small subunit ribosomal protein S4
MQTQQKKEFTQRSPRQQFNRPSNGQNFRSNAGGNFSNSNSGNAFSGPKTPAPIVKKKPGQHGDKIVRKTEFGKRLLAKQAIQQYLNITSKALSNACIKAAKVKQPMNEALCASIASRLDVVLIFTGLLGPVGAALQAISHGKIFVNGKKVNKRSFTLKINDKITFSKDTPLVQSVKDAKDNIKLDHIKYLSIENPTDLTEASITFVNIPSLETAPDYIKDNVKGVIEFYSR